MESSWRDNVLEAGYALGNYGLIARLAPGLPVAIAKRLDTDIAFDLLGVTPGFGSVWTYGGTFPVPPDEPHFPYGIDVLPD